MRKNNTYVYTYISSFVLSTKEVIIATRLILFFDQRVGGVCRAAAGWWWWWYLRARSDQLFCHFTPLFTPTFPCPSSISVFTPRYTSSTPSFAEHSDMKLSHINNNQLAQWLLGGGGLCLIYRRLSVGFNVITMIRLTMRATAMRRVRGEYTSTVVENTMLPGATLT